MADRETVDEKTIETEENSDEVDGEVKSRSKRSIFFAKSMNVKYKNGVQYKFDGERWRPVVF